MARLEGATNHKLEFIEDIYVKFHVINPTSARSFVPTPKKLANKGAIIIQKIKISVFLYAVGIYASSDKLGHKNLKRISKKLLKWCEQLDSDNINFSTTIKDIIQVEKDNLDISVTIFEYGGFHSIKEDDNDDANTKERIVIKDARVSPYALKRQHLA